MQKTNVFSLFNNHFIGQWKTPKNIIIKTTRELKTVQQLSHPLLGAKTTALAFHPTMPLIAFVNETVIYILDAKEHRVLNTIDTHTAITKLFFLSNTSYLIAATKNSRVLQYRYDTPHYITRLCSFTKSKNNTLKSFTYNHLYCAVSGYDGIIKVIDLYKGSSKNILTSKPAHITAMAFTDPSTLLFCNSEGKIFLQDVEDTAKKQELQTIHNNITNIILFKQSPHAVLLSKEHSLLLLNRKDLSIVKINFLNQKKIPKSVLLYNDQDIFLLHQDHNVEKIKLPSQNDLRDTIENKDLVKAFQLLEYHPLLHDASIAKQLFKAYQNYQNSIFLTALYKKNKMLLEPLKAFQDIQITKEAYQEAADAYDHYQKLQHFVKEQRFRLAYILVEKFPLLRTTQEYHEMEHTYNSIFLQAQRALQKGDKQKAQELLNPFITIMAKQKTIQLLLRHNRVYLDFLKALSKKDYISAAKLSQTSPNFKELSEYTNLQKHLEIILQEIQYAINSAKLDSAEKLIQSLQQCNKYKEDLQRVSNKLYKAKKLLQSYENNDFLRCYEILDTSPQLRSLQLGVLLEKHWNKLLFTIEILASKGDIQQLQKHLGELLFLKTRQYKIANLLRLGFQQAIKKYIAACNYKQAEKMIYSYIDTFGTDKELEDILHLFEKKSRHKLAITLTKKRYFKKIELP
jgi:hypothetical protein